jgi:hypothetical protein
MSRIQTLVFALLCLTAGLAAAGPWTYPDFLYSRGKSAIFWKKSPTEALK